MDRKPDFVHSVYDTGEGDGYMDRYTVVYYPGTGSGEGGGGFPVVTMSADPENPQGVSQYAGEFSPLTILGWKGYIPWREVPDRVKAHIIKRGKG